MKIKIGWSTGIVIAIISFMIFILTFVYKSIAYDEYQHELVSEDYYKDELHFQEEIDKVNHAKTLKNNISLANTNDGVLITFPAELEQKSISGTIYFQRLSNKKLDFSKEIKLADYQQLISSEKLIAGKWLVKIDWKHKNDAYLFKDTWFR